MTSPDQPRIPAPDLVLRPLGTGDLAAVVRLQHRVYATRYHEGEGAYAARLADFPAGCLGVFAGPALAAHAFGFPWTARRALPLDAGPVVGDGARAETLYLHDVAVDAAHRGRGLADALVLALASGPLVRGLATASLVAVQGAAGYWRRLGFQPTDVDPGPGYGDEATFMEAGLAALRGACRRAVAAGGGEVSSGA